MSKIKIVGHASGSGVLTIAAPNTNTDRTITIPDVTGTLLDSGSDLPAANLTGTVATARLGSGTAGSGNFLRGDGSWQTAGSTSASDLTSGTLPMARLSGTLPALSAANLTAIPAANITGTLPAISGANLTGVAVAGISSSADATAIEIDSSENVGINKSSGFGSYGGTGIKYTKGDGTLFVGRDGGVPLLVNRETSQGDMIAFNASGASIVKLGTDSGGFFIGTDTGGNTKRLTITSDGKVGIGDTSPSARLDLGNWTSNTVGGNETLRIGEQAFRVMTGGENAVMCLDRDNAGGTKKIMQAWNPDSGSVSIGNCTPIARGMLSIKPLDINQVQLKLLGANYGYGAEIMHQNGSESGTVGNTRGWSKWDIYTLGETRRFWTASSQIGTDTQYWSVNNTKIMDLDNDGMFNIRSFDPLGGSAGATFNTEGKLTISANTSSSRNLIGFYNTNINVGNIIASGSSTSYSTSSDYRLKENVVDMTGAITRLKTLQPKIFNWIADDTNTLVDGFIAHEVTAVPEAIIGEKDAMIAEVLYTQDDENLEIIPEGKIIGDVKEPARIDPQTIDQSKLVPLLVGALQEAITRIETLENA